MLIRLFLPTLFSCIFFCCDGQDNADWDALFKDFLSDEPGGAIIVKKGDKTIYLNSFGVADIETNTPIDEHTIFNTGSISKTFVAYGILILEEQGLLSTEDEIGKYFPDFENKEIAKKVKIKHLLNHTSGLPDRRHTDLHEEFYMTAKDAENWEPIKKARYLNFEPGERYEYSNPAFNGLALIIEQVSGMKWQDFIKEKIFLPSGMNESVITDGPYPESGVAHAYTRSGDAWVENDYGEFSTFAAAGNGGVWCSITDLAKYETAIQNHVFLSEDGINKSRTISNPGNAVLLSTKVGMSWFVFREEYKDNWIERDFVSHTGSQGGFRSFYIYIPSEKILYAILFNRPPKDIWHFYDGGLELIKKNNFYNLK